MLIVFVRPYYARKFTFHIMHESARAMAIAIALPGFNNLGGSVTPTFLSRNRFCLQLSPHCPKMNKKTVWEVKKKFKISVHGKLNPAILQLQGV